MATTLTTMTGSDPQDKWIEAQIEGGDLTKDSENIGDLIRWD